MGSLESTVSLQAFFPVRESLTLVLKGEWGSEYRVKELGFRSVVNRDHDRGIYGENARTI